ncbi:hypothetical protein QE152_g5769 [Popillia japonica]|uniref:Uncharacterized protein n=1 Tax=Popillia japonica TaxID=7064 RepID=A0AAW1MND3_POPJA
MYRLSTSQSIYLLPEAFYIRTKLPSANRFCRRKSVENHFFTIVLVPFSQKIRKTRALNWRLSMQYIG